ncbi:MAG: hypothetical protein LBU16_03615 [Treponema sp.]|nr:hypothetical protein [Treponema sp.]
MFLKLPSFRTAGKHLLITHVTQKRMRQLRPTVLSRGANIYVEQDFLAQTLVFNMTQDVLGEAEEQARERGKEREYRHEVKINENIAIGLWKEQFIRLMLEDDKEKQEQLLRRLQADMERNIVPVRQLKGRGRKWNYFNKYKCNQKPGF